jgi:putative DNA primase/helicase
MVENWWQKSPNANVGIVTGPSGLVVLDIDPRNGGNQSFETIRDAIEGRGRTLTSHTGGGGRHLVFADPERLVRPCKPLPGIDILAGNSLMVAPPSLHKSGKRYAWADIDVQPLPVPNIILKWGQS